MCERMDQAGLALLQIDQLLVGPGVVEHRLHWVTQADVSGLDRLAPPLAHREPTVEVGETSFVVAPELLLLKELTLDRHGVAVHGCTETVIGELRSRRQRRRDTWSLPLHL